MAFCGLAVCCESDPIQHSLTLGLSSAESVQKNTAVVRPKDSAAPFNWRESGSTVEESRASFQEELTFNDQTGYSYQQISCLDSVIRYKDKERHKVIES